MFKIQELQRISSDYFLVFQKSAFAVTVRSKCTGHDWHILYQEYGNFKGCAIYHRHHPTDSFHPQWNTTTLHRAINKIQAHDAFYCEKIEKKKTRQNANKAEGF